MILSILEIFFLMALVMLFESQTEGLSLLRAPARGWDHCDASARRPARCWRLPVHPAVRPAEQEGTNFTHLESRSPRRKLCKGKDQDLTIRKCSDSFQMVLMKVI